MYVARVRNGFVPASRRQVFEKIRHLVSPVIPFANLPDTHKSRWGDELTEEKMEEPQVRSRTITHFSGLATNQELGICLLMCLPDLLTRYTYFTKKTEVAS